MMKNGIFVLTSGVVVAKLNGCLFQERKCLAIRERERERSLLCGIAIFFVFVEFSTLLFLRMK